MSHDYSTVLIEGELWKPADVTKAAAQKFEHDRCDGPSRNSIAKRYARCYPHPDLHTPTFEQFRAIALRPRSK